VIAALIASIAANTALAWLLTRELRDARTTARREIADLCQRIQAPDVAVQQHALETGEITAPRPVSEFDDSDHWEARGLSKEQLAEEAMKLEMTLA